MIKMVKLAQLKIRVNNTKEPVRLFCVEHDGKKVKDVDVTTKFEHGWFDSSHFQWWVPDGRYWLSVGKSSVCGIDVKNGVCTYNKPVEPKEVAPKEVAPKVVKETMSAGNTKAGAHDMTVKIENNIGDTKNKK